MTLSERKYAQRTFKFHVGQTHPLVGTSANEFRRPRTWSGSADAIMII